MAPPETLKDHLLKRTKIVCTLGPATDNETVLKGVIQGGMNVARLNLVHDTIHRHLERAEMVRRLAAELGTHVAVMLDTRGPDVRIGELATESVELVDGAEFVLTTEDVPGTAREVSVSFPGLPSLFAPGDKVFLHDGRIELTVLQSDEQTVRCQVVSGGTLRSRKGVNLPGKTVPLPILTNDDVTDLRAGAKYGIDYIAASFVRTADDIAEIRHALGGTEIPIIAKIESAPGVENLDAIIEESDGIMVARGDLGVEIPPEEVPGVQKRIIRACRDTRKPVITATEMLISMTHSRRPTRAEIADVANAVLDGTSAVMLSQETAVGRYPIEVVRMMARVCRRAEKDIPFEPVTPQAPARETSVRVGIAHAACYLAHDIDASAIICVTDSGATATIFSHYRPRQPVLACTPFPEVARRLSLYWGVMPILVDAAESVEALLKKAMDLGKAKGMIAEGDRVVFTGNLSGRGGETNLLATVGV